MRRYSMGVLRRIKPLVDRGVKLSKPPARGGLTIHWSDPVKAMMSKMQAMGDFIGDTVTTMIEAGCSSAHTTTITPR